MHGDAAWKASLLLNNLVGVSDSWSASAQANVFYDTCCSSCILATPSMRFDSVLEDPQAWFPRKIFR